LNSAETFWDFSLRAYGQPGVAQACLALQDEHGADVNLLLFFCWAESRGVGMDDATFQQALGFSRAWADKVVRPLRGVRRWMKSDGCSDPLADFDTCMALREAVKKVELRAEKSQQAALESMLLRQQSGGRQNHGIPAAAGTLLQRYCEAAGIAGSEEVRQKLAVILGAAALPPGGGSGH
jgi:uncharacterized protein (TIGR02444 family)